MMMLPQWLSFDRETKEAIGILIAILSFAIFGYAML